ncbi:hypothetical protein DQ244_03705 [Blastococcus sp. TBT05-19]|uniref:hypothetical protein n=1 Tax=Blastococcus sp. TBT05-19 TaxID=2250581 RepID=UPI000DEBCF58|nr:hypothetical protein [Blastococcus sp. TBT05-19]RBY94430.1 hypothetical protein DQ244_03705 [Blastococcus sp. TBT05-19]
MSGEFPSLGFDPAPGDIAVAAQVAGSVSDAARALEEICAVLTGAADGEWRGQAATAFRDLLSDDLRPRVDSAARSFDAARLALHDWLDTMYSASGQALSLEARHAEAVRKARSAHATYAGIPAPAPSTGQPPTPEQQQTQAELSRARIQASTDAAAADAEVAGIEVEARDLSSEYEDKGRATASRLQHAMDIAPNEPGIWDRFVESLGNALGDLRDAIAYIGDRIIEVLEQLAPLLQFIGDMASSLGALLSVLALFPGLQFLGGAALVLGVVALTGHYLAAVGGTGSFVDAFSADGLMGDALGVVLGFGALKVGKKLVDAARSGSSAAGGAPAVMRVPQLVGGPKEMVPNLFQLATRGGYSMGAQEAGWRLVGLKISQGNFALNVAQAPQNIGNVVGLRDGVDVRGPARPAAVR